MMKKFLDKIRTEGINPDIVREIIDEHKTDHDRMLKLYERYKASVEGVPIFQRKPVEYEDFETGAIKRIDNKVNNTLNNAFDADIVDTKVGYMFGHPIVYSFDDGGSETTMDRLISDFNTRNNIEDEDSELGKMATICGTGARLVYVDTDGNERVKNINPWEAVFLTDGDISEPDYALRYYRTYDDLIKAEFYDSEYVYYFSGKKNGGFTLNDQQKHLFDNCPLFGLANNKELMGDAEKVLKLIDAYDRTLSDVNNEVEQYRLAYLILKGLGADEDTLSKMKKTGIMEFFDKEDGASYLTKDINDTLIEHHLDRLEKNILRFAKSVNFTDEQFGGNISGIAMKFKIMALENKCITMERKMTSALRYQFKVIFSAWEKRNRAQKDDYLKVKMQFTRNLPVNIAEAAQSTAQLKGMVSERTRLSLLPFITNVDQEMDKMQEDIDEYTKNMPKLDDSGGDDG